MRLSNWCSPTVTWDLVTGQALAQRPGVQPGFCTSQVFPGDARDGEAVWKVTSKGVRVLQFDGYLLWVWAGLSDSIE